MKWIPIIFLSLTLLSAVGVAASYAAPSRSYSGSITFGSLARNYEVSLPRSYSEEKIKSFPLVIVLHGLGGSGRVIRKSLKFDDAADRMGYIAVYPDGIDGSWADGGGITPADKSGADDVGFISALMDDLSQRLRIDLSRVYVAGFSNGGMLAYRLACELSRRIVAVASVLGAMTGNLPDECIPQKPVSVIHIHGISDGLVPWGGGEVQIPGVSGWRAHSVPSGVEMWARMNGCLESAIGFYGLSAGFSVVSRKFDKCRDGAGVALYGIVEWGHAFPPVIRKIPIPLPSFEHIAVEITMEEAILRFFDKHRRK